MESASKTMTLAWWALIIVSMALIIKSPWQDLEPKESAAGDERVTLAVLELQGRFLIGAAQTQSNELEQQLVQMEAWAVTDQTAVAVAAIRFFIDPEGSGKWRALALVNAQLKRGQEGEKGKSSSGDLLLKQVQTILKGDEQVDGAAQEQIRSQMGWFGDLLLSAGKSEGEPGAEEALALRKQSVKMVFTSSFFVMFAIVMALLGFVLLVTGILALGSGKMKMVGVAARLPSQPYLAAFALYLTLMVIANFLSVTVHPIFAVSGMFVSMGIAFCWPRFCGLSWRESLRGFGWRRGKGVFAEIVAGVVGYVAMAPIFALGLSATLLLTMLSGWLASQGADAEGVVDTASRPLTHPVIAWVADGGWKAKLGVLFLASVMAPLFEETMFRGALYGVFRKRWGFIVSGLLSGLIFAAVHPQGFLAIPALTAMGFGFAVIREWRGTLIASMAAHSLHNGILVCALLLAFS